MNMTFSPFTDMFQKVSSLSLLSESMFSCLQNFLFTRVKSNYHYHDADLAAIFASISYHLPATNLPAAAFIDKRLHIYFH